MADRPSGSDGFDHAYREVFHPQYPSALVLRDSEGRLLGEGNAPRDLVEKEHIEWRPSRYPGSRYRHPKPINASALKQLTRHWDDVLELVQATRAGFVRRYDLDGPLAVSHLWRFSRFTVTMPNYLANRQGGESARVPAVAAVAFKSIAGIFIVAADMSFRDADLDEVLTPDEIIGHADEHGLFGGAMGVCAGPPHLMRELLSAVVSGSGSGTSEAPLERVVGDAEIFFRYAALYTKLEFTKQIAVCEVQGRVARMYSALTSKEAPDSDIGRAVVADVDAAATHAPARLIAILEQQLRELEWWATGAEPPLDEVLRHADAAGRGDPSLGGESVVAGAAADCAALEKEALRRLSSIQRDIGDLLGRPSPPRELREEDATAILGPSVSRRLARHLTHSV
ncbi:MAG: hypothetical protein M3323_01510 [Actinomycetota bacterium]|nr:hypothetical protein [Actinomycetota bacterium]